MPSPTYFPPIISAAGLSVPSFAAIQNALIDSYQTIYGATTYLGNDSADYQWISAIALKLSDAMSLCQLAYNARSPLTAIGADLDSIFKINGLARLSSTSSTAVLTLTGTVGATVLNAVIQDTNGNLWSLPNSVTIGSGGTVDATAICQQSGAITANDNTIINPVGGFTAGWTGVTNNNPAIAGQPTESDSNSRARQSISVALPSLTRLAGTVAALLQVPNVTRVNVLENQKSVTDSYGNESHSITCVVEGGNSLAIATAIYNNKGIGANTQGATATTMTIVDVTDPNSGNITAIGFIIAQYVPIHIGITVHGLTSAFTSTVQTNIVTALVNYLNSLEIGESVTQSALYAAAMSVMTNISQPIFSIKSLTLGEMASSIFVAAPGSSIGTGYVVNDVLTVVQAGASGGTVTVTSVNGSGGITGLNSIATTGGTGYSVAINLATTGGTGSAATVDIVSVEPNTTSDISVDFYQAAVGETANVVLVVV